MSKKPKIGLALGGGGSRGLAHIGVLKVLEKYNVPIDYIAGTSIGSIIGGFYAAHKNTEIFTDFLEKNNWRDFSKVLLDPTVKGGIISGEKIEKYLKQYFGDYAFDELSIPFAAVCTDLENGQTYIFDEGESIIKSMRASFSIPLIFRPTKIGDKTLVDGGNSEPIPVSTVKNMGADIVIAVNLDQYFLRNKKINSTQMVNIALQAFDILRMHLSAKDCKSADIVISPEIYDSSLVNWKKFIEKDGLEYIRLGELAAQKEIKKIQAIINS